MTVRELIRELQQCDLDAEVHYRNHDLYEGDGDPPAEAVVVGGIPASGWFCPEGTGAVLIR